MKNWLRNPGEIRGDHNDIDALSAAPDVATLDREAISVLRELAAERLAAAHTETEHDPCDLCGLGSSPHWRGPARRKVGFVCGRCSSWLDTFPDSDPRDLCATVIAGLTTPTKNRRIAGFGHIVGLEYFVETGRTEPNRTPWEHVNIRAIRTTTATLANARHIGPLPPKWDPAKRITW